nr:hypothetical protein [uncultured Bifidobacterium sp.]
MAEKFGRRHYASYMLVDFSKAPDDVRATSSTRATTSTTRRTAWRSTSSLSNRTRTRQ